MAENSLTIAIGADTAKLRADLALAEASIRGLGQQLRAASQAAQKGTGSADTVRDLAAQYDAAARHVARLRAEIRAAEKAPGFAELGKGAGAFTEAIGKAREAFGLFGEAINEVARLVIPEFREAAVAGVAGVAVGIIKATHDAARSITELRNLARSTGLPIAAIGGMKTVFGEAAVSTERLNQALVRFTDEFAKAQLETTKSTEVFGGSVTVLRGMGAAAGDAAGNVSVLRGNSREAASSIAGDVTVFRGGVTAVRDISTAFKSVGMGPEIIRSFAGRPLDALIEFTRRLALVKDEAERVRIGVQMFGRTYREIAPALTNLSTSLPHAIEERKEQGLNPTDDDIRRADRYNVQLSKLSEQWERAAQEFGLTFMPAITWALEQTSESLRNMRTTAEAFGRMWDAAFVRAWDGWVKAGETAMRIIEHLWSGITDRMGAALSKAWKAVQDFGSLLGKAAGGLSLGGDSGAAGAIPGYAGGGTVSGPGGTDRVPIWATAGEFVMSLGAVRRYGAGFMAALNAQRFAEGGQVGDDSVTILRGIGAAAGDASSNAASNVSVLRGTASFAPPTFKSSSSQGDAQAAPAPTDARPNSGGRFTSTVYDPLKPVDTSIKDFSRLPTQLSSILQSLRQGIIPDNVPRWAVKERLTSDAGAWVAPWARGTTRVAVDLNWGGHTFEVQTDKATADDIARFARYSRLVSGGKKPSWSTS